MTEQVKVATRDEFGHEVPTGMTVSTPCTLSAWTREALKVGFAYLLWGGLWIFYSDSLLSAFVSDAATLGRMQTYKGWFFVFATALILFALLHRTFRTIMLVEARARRLRNERENAEAADRMKSVFLASMSHELRTPLNSIIGFTGILLQELAGPLSAEQKKQLLMVQGSSRHLLSLINDVLDISKIEAGQLELFTSTFDVKQSLESSTALLAPLAGKKGIALHLEVSEASGLITTDRRRLEQVFLNLLSNAIKFTEKGQVRLACRTEGNDYIFSVTDTGIGIRPEDIPRLFHPFSQLDTGVSRKYDGTGLGLSICKKLLCMMGGSISVESTWGQGSSFTVRIPKTMEV